MSTLTKLADVAHECGVRLNPLMDDSFTAGSVLEFRTKTNVQKVATIDQIAALRPRPPGSNLTLPDISRMKNFTLGVEAAFQVLAGKVNIAAKAAVSLKSVTSVELEFGQASGFRCDLVAASEAIDALAAADPNFWRSPLGGYLGGSRTHVVWGEIWVASLSYTFKGSGGEVVDINAALSVAGVAPVTVKTGETWAWTNAGTIRSSVPTLFGLETARFSRQKHLLETTS